MTNQLKNVPEGHDPALWEIAQRRASFKGHLLTYIVVIAFLWGIWFFGNGRYGNDQHYMWPVWPMLGWGIGLAFHFLGAYVFPKANLVENEYQKLKNKQ
jgi:2TM domain